MPESRRITVAIVGAGLMGRWHAVSARRAGARVAAVMDTDLAAARRLGQRVGADAYDDLASMLVHARPQVVHLCTPRAAHDEQCRTTLAAGCHVLCEKPLALEPSSVEALLAAAHAADRSLLPVHQFPSQDGTRKVQRRLAEFGTLRHIEFRLCSAGAEGRAAADRDEILRDILPHPLSVLTHLLPGTVLATAPWSAVTASAGELLATTRVGPTTVSILLSLSVRPTEAAADLFGTHACGRIDFFHGFATLHTGRVSRSRKIVRPLLHPARELIDAAVNLGRRAARWEPAYPGLRTLCRDFYGSLDDRATRARERARTTDVYRTVELIARIAAMTSTTPTSGGTA